MILLEYSLAVYFNFGIRTKSRPRLIPPEQNPSEKTTTKSRKKTIMQMDYSRQLSIRSLPGLGLADSDFQSTPYTRLKFINSSNHLLGYRLCFLSI